jgi:hypothetical protein
MAATALARVNTAMIAKGQDTGLNELNRLHGYMGKRLGIGSQRDVTRKPV